MATVHIFSSPNCSNCQQQKAGMLELAARLSAKYPGRVHFHGEALVRDGGGVGRSEFMRLGGEHVPCLIVSFPNGRVVYPNKMLGCEISLDVLGHVEQILAKPEDFLLVSRMAGSADGAELAVAALLAPG